MPAKLDVKAVMAEGFSEERASAICNAVLKAVMAEIGGDKSTETSAQNITVERAALAAERAALAAEGALQEARRIRESVIAQTAVLGPRWIRKAVLPLRQVAKDLPIYYAKVLCVHEPDKQDDSVTPAGVAKIKARYDDEIESGKRLEMGVNHEGAPSQIFKALGTDIVGEDVELDGEKFHKGDLVLRFFAPVRPNGVSLEGFDEDDLPGTHAKAGLAKYTPVPASGGVINKQPPRPPVGPVGYQSFLHGAEDGPDCPSCGEDLRHDKCPKCGAQVVKMIHGAWPAASENIGMEKARARFRPIYKEDSPNCPSCGEDLRQDACPKCGTPVAKVQRPEGGHFKPFLSYRQT